MPHEFFAILPHIVTVAAIVSGGVSWLFKVVVEKRLDAAAQKTLAEFKHNLDSTAAASAYDYQRRLHDYNLFVSKKHEVIANLHALIHEARTAMRLYASFAGDGPEIIAESKRQAIAAFNELSGYFRTNELYLPDGIAALLNQAVTRIGDVYQAAPDGRGEEVGERSLEYRKLFDRLTKEMRAELGRAETSPASLLPVHLRTQRPDPEA